MEKKPYFSNFLILPSLILFLLVFGNNCKMLEKNSRLDKTTLDKSLESNFLNPPVSAGSHVWWHWMNGNITREGITADLEAMQRVGIAGWQAFHLENSIVNLEKYIHAYQKSASTHGILYWDVPEGDWTVFRIGYTPRGVNNHLALPEGTGLEIDKLSRKAAERGPDWPSQNR